MGESSMALTAGGGREMSKTLLLHIGTRKTGTTSIQWTLAGAVDHLGSFCYPLFEDDRDQNRLITLYLGHDELPLHWREAYPSDDRRFQDMRRRYRRLLFDQLESASSAVISAEALSSFLTPAATRRLRDDLQAIGYRDVHVILYVRDPADYFLSFLQQVLKVTSPSAPMGPHPASFTYDFRRIAQTWEQSFPGNVVIRGFPGTGGSDVVQDFAGLVQQYLGVSLPPSTRRMNTTISAEGMQILQDYRLLFGPDSGGLSTPDIARLVRFLERSADDLSQHKPVLKHEVAQQIRAKHQADADFICRRYGVDLPWLEGAGPAGSPKTAIHPGQPHRVADLVECVDPQVVHELLLRLAHSELVLSGKRSLVRRIVHRAYRAVRL